MEQLMKLLTEIPEGNDETRRALEDDAEKISKSLDMAGPPAAKAVDALLGWLAGRQFALFAEYQRIGFSREEAMTLLVETQKLGVKRELGVKRGRAG